MRFQEFLPAFPLQSFIHHYAILEDDRSSAEGITDRTPPNLSTGLLFYYHLEGPVHITNGIYNDVLPQSFLMPQCIQSQSWLYHKPLGIFAIMFKPGKLRHFFPYPLLAYQDRALPIHSLGDAGLLELEDRIFEAKTTEKRIEAANQYLLGRLSRINCRIDLIDWTLSKLFTNPGRHINDLPLEVKVSERHFRRLFEREMGVSPKAWQKLARFTQAMRLMQSPRFRNLSAVAHACGYYDQTQFIGQFKFFTQLTPGEFLKQTLPITELTAWREDVVDRREMER
ncbi:MAG: AraC family transcriptional regulator [Lewinellaceae bacterium]|nr:AraC family transcriptional regulator [Lewinellaceae bacterium]